VERISTKTRTGFVPETNKVNQDSFLIVKDFASLAKLWMVGVMDGHGQHGHSVS
jgi:serine/threonine protein phosphatase PrpC